MLKYMYQALLNYFNMEVKPGRGGPGCELEKSLPDFVGSTVVPGKYKCSLSSLSEKELCLAHGPVASINHQILGPVRGVASDNLELFNSKSSSFLGPIISWGPMKGDWMIESPLI